MAYAGYYTLVVRPGVRVVVLNSQLGYIFNFYTLLSAHPVADEMFGWAEQILHGAAAAGERVLMVGHISARRVCCVHFAPPPPAPILFSALT
jgi:hypothetical protein